MNIIVRRPLTCVATLLLLTLAAGSQAAEATGPEPLRVNVESVEDHRSSMSGNTCQVRLAALGDELDEDTTVIDTKLTRAVDDLDRDLVAKPGSMSSRYGNAFRSLMSPSRGPLRITLTLRNPSRRATAIKVIEGVAQLHTPTATNEGVITLTDPLATEGVPLKHKTLEKYGIEITYITEEAAAELRQVGSPQEEQMRLEAVAGEVERRRLLRESAQREAVMSQTPAERTDSTAVLPPSRATVQTATPAPEPRSSQSTRISFKVTDPNNKLISLTWCDAYGSPLRGMMPPMVYQQIRSFMFRQKLPPDARLVAYIASDASVTSRPFKVENIALP